MNKNKKFKLIRYSSAFIFLVAGGVFLFIPFTPLGYIFAFIGLILLFQNSKWYKKLSALIKRNGSKKRMDKAEDKVQHWENNIYNKL